ncbi:hypothetical protein Tco_1146716 [Tanacetum coccineum]
MLQFLDQVGIDLPYDRHAHIVEDKYHRCGALNLTNINDKNLVVTIDYILDETVLADFMSRFIPEVESNRELGFVSLRVRHLDDMFSWVFRKLDVYLIAAIVGGVVHELGDRYYSNTRKNRWLESTELTGYTESYRDLFVQDGDGVIDYRSQMIFRGVKFVPFKDALAENFANDTEMLLAASLMGTNLAASDIIRAVIPKLRLHFDESVLF